jgi:hypothetical protein
VVAVVDSVSTNVVVVAGVVVLVVTEAVSIATTVVVVGTVPPPLQCGLKIISMISSTSKGTAADRGVLKEEESLSLMDPPPPLLWRRLRANQSLRVCSHRWRPIKI